MAQDTVLYNSITRQTVYGVCVDAVMQFEVVLWSKRSCCDVCTGNALPVLLGR